MIEGEFLVGQGPSTIETKPITTIIRRVILNPFFSCIKPFVSDWADFTKRLARLRPAHKRRMIIFSAISAIFSDLGAVPASRHIFLLSFFVSMK